MKRGDYVDEDEEEEEEEEGWMFRILFVSLESFAPSSLLKTALNYHYYTQLTRWESEGGWVGGGRPLSLVQWTASVGDCVCVLSVWELAALFRSWAKLGRHWCVEHMCVDAVSTRVGKVCWECVSDRSVSVVCVCCVCRITCVWRKCVSVTCVSRKGVRREESMGFDRQRTSRRVATTNYRENGPANDRILWTTTGTHPSIEN